MQLLCDVRLQDTTSNTSGGNGGGGGDDLLAAIRNFGGAGGGLKSVSRYYTVLLLNFLPSSTSFWLITDYKQRISKIPQDHRN